LPDPAASFCNTFLAQPPGKADSDVDSPLSLWTLVVFVIPTAANPLKNRPSRPLLISVLAVVAVAIAYTVLESLLRFTPPPVSLLGAIAFLAVTYLFLV
jgi:P-type Mg2+ transporter